MICKDIPPITREIDCCPTFLVYPKIEIIFYYRRGTIFYFYSAQNPEIKVRVYLTPNYNTMSLFKKGRKFTYDGDTLTYP